jgi:predicted RNA methylase
MKRKQLESLLQQVDGFDEPKVELEQYVTSAEVATAVLTCVNEEYGDLDGKTVLDLGSGTGTLSIGE